MIDGLIMIFALANEGFNFSMRHIITKVLNYWGEIWFPIGYIKMEEGVGE